MKQDNEVADATNVFVSLLGEGVKNVSQEFAGLAPCGKSKGANALKATNLGMKKEQHRYVLAVQQASSSMIRRGEATEG